KASSARHPKAAHFPAPLAAQSARLNIPSLPVRSGVFLLVRWGSSFSSQVYRRGNSPTNNNLENRGRKITRQRRAPRSSSRSRPRDSIPKNELLHTNQILRPPRPPRPRRPQNSRENGVLRSPRRKSARNFHAAAPPSREKNRKETGT